MRGTAICGYLSSPSPAPRPVSPGQKTPPFPARSQATCPSPAAGTCANASHATHRNRPRQGSARNRGGHQILKKRLCLRFRSIMQHRPNQGQRPPPQRNPPNQDLSRLTPVCKHTSQRLNRIGSSRTESDVMIFRDLEGIP